MADQPEHHRASHECARSDSHSTSFQGEHLSFLSRLIFRQSFQSNQRLVLLLEGTNLAIGTDTSDPLLLAFDSVIRQDTLFFIARSDKGTEVELL